MIIGDEIKNFIKPDAHAVYSPSGADRWMNCPASIKQSKGIPEETSKYAAEGTLAHSVCEAVFAQRFYGIPMSSDLQMQLIQTEDQGAEMMYCAEAYVDLLESWLKLDHEIGKVLWFGIEKGIPIFPEEGCYGTADFVIIGTKGAAIIDFKYGRGKEVQAGSTQLKMYALGLYNYIKGIPEDYEFNAVVFQPRINITAKWAGYSPEEMKEFGEEVYQAIQETRKPDAQLIDGNHCFWCASKRAKDPNLKCPVIKQKAIDVANENFDKFLVDMNDGRDILGKPESYSPSTAKRDAALLKILSLKPLIDDMAEMAEEEIMFRIEKGEAIEGAMVRDKIGRRKWKHKKTEDIEADIMAHFGDLFPNGATKTKTMPLSITEVEKVVGKGVCDALTVKPVSKKLHISDEKTQEILDSLTNYSRMITNN